MLKPYVFFDFLQGEKWIQHCMTGQETRNKLTDYWAGHASAIPQPVQNNPAGHRNLGVMRLREV